MPTRELISGERARAAMMFATPPIDVNVDELLFTNNATYRPMIMDYAAMHSWEMGDKTFELNLADK